MSRLFVYFLKSISPWNELLFSVLVERMDPERERERELLLRTIFSNSVEYRRKKKVGGVKEEKREKKDEKRFY